MTDNLQSIVDEMRESLRTTNGAFYRITWHDGRVLVIDVMPDGVTSILRWQIDEGPTQTMTVDPEKLIENLYVFIRQIMKPATKASAPS